MVKKGLLGHLVPGFLLMFQVVNCFTFTFLVPLNGLPTLAAL